MPAKFKIAVDFDGTIVDHRFPDIGPAVPLAVETLQRWSADPRVELILWTMRCDGLDHPYLSDAIGWCKKNGIIFAHHNCGDQKWTLSPKVYAHVYIDDSAAGTPMLELASFKRPCVDWEPIVRDVEEKITQHFMKEVKEHAVQSG